MATKQHKMAMMDDELVVLEQHRKEYKTDEEFFAAWIGSHEWFAICERLRLVEGLAKGHFADLTRCLAELATERELSKTFEQERDHYESLLIIERAKVAELEKKLSWPKPEYPNIKEGLVVKIKL